MKGRLDTRGALYGEPRLSDAMVRALRAAAGPGLVQESDCYHDGSNRHSFGTVRSRALCNLTMTIFDGLVVATTRGHSVLRAIDAAPAPSLARSGS